MTQIRLRTGRVGEAVAADLYLRSGFRVIARNWRCKAGELDIVVARDDLVVFCEVKTRSGSAFGGGYESVTRVKRTKLRRLAEMFLYEAGLAPDRVRFDVASVTLSAGMRPDVQIFDDAF